MILQKESFNGEKIKMYGIILLKDLLKELKNQQESSI
jgi:hypothetical protein